MSDFPVPPMFPPMDDGNKGPKPLPGGNMYQPPRPPQAPPDSYEGSAWEDKSKQSRVEGTRNLCATLQKNLMSEKVRGYGNYRSDGVNLDTMPPKVMKQYRRESIRADNQAYLEEVRKELTGQVSFGANLE